MYLDPYGRLDRHVVEINVGVEWPIDTQLKEASHITGKVSARRYRGFNDCVVAIGRFIHQRCGDRIVGGEFVEANH